MNHPGIGLEPLLTGSSIAPSDKTVKEPGPIPMRGKDGCIQSSGVINQQMVHRERSRWDWGGVEGVGVWKG